MHPDGPRTPRAWDDVVAPPVPRPAVPAAAPMPPSGSTTLPLTAAPAPTAPGPSVVPPPSPAGTNGSRGAAAPTAAPRVPPPPSPGSAAPAPSPAPPAPWPPAPGPERANGHLRAAPLPAVDPDASPEDTQPLPRRGEHSRPSNLNRGWSARRRSRKMRARKVRRQIRHVDPWSVLKFSLLFYLVLFLVVLTAGVLLWNAAASTGLVDNIESFVEELFGFETFQFEPNQMLRASALVGLVMVVAGTATNVLLAVLFNLISDLVGGIRVTVIEEESRRPVV